MALQSVHSNRLCELLGNRTEPRHPENTSAAGTQAADPILVAAMFYCAAEAARADRANPPTGNALADSVLSMVTASLGFLDTNRVLDLSQSKDGRHLVHFKTPTGVMEAAVFVPSLSGQQGLQGLDAAVFETGVVLSVLAQSLRVPLTSLSTPKAVIAMTESGRSFLDGVNSLLAEHGEALAVAGAMVHNAVPWAIVTSDQRSREILQRIVDAGVVPKSPDSRVALAFRHLLQTAAVTDFVVTALNQYIDQGLPLPDHDAVTAAVASADPNWVVEPARSLVLETVAYSSNRTASKCANAEDSVSHWMHGAKFAWRGLMSSRIPRQAKYVAENLAQASKATGEPFGKKCADAIFCGAYTVGHLYMFVRVTADKLRLTPKDGAATTTIQSADEWLREWEAIPAYKDEPFFVQRFMGEGLRVTADNLVVNMLAGVLLLEQFLRDTSAKRRKLEGNRSVHLLTAYAQQPDKVLRVQDRPLLFTEPFLWAYQLLRLAFGQGEEGVTAVANCGYSSLAPRTAAAVSELLQLATTPAKERGPRTYADSLPALVHFLGFLAGMCPEGGNERTYLHSLSSELGTVSFT